MKLLFLAIVLVAQDVFVTGQRHSIDMHSPQPKNLNDLLQQFLQFIPMDKEVQIFMDYLEVDPDVQKAVLFLYSDSFDALVYMVESSTEYRQFLSYLYDSGVDIYKYVNKLNEMLDLPPFQHSTTDPLNPLAEESGVIRMIDDMLALLPLQEIWDWYNNVCSPNPDFQELLVRLRSPEFKQLVMDVHNSSDYQQLTTMLKSFGIDVEEIEKTIQDFLNGNSSRIARRNVNSLKDRFEEFVAFIPTDNITAIVTKYLDSDTDVQDVFNYLKSDEFQGLVVELEGTKQLTDVLDFVYDHGVDIYSYINSALDILGIPDFPTPPTTSRRIFTPRSGFTNMFDDIKNALPLHDMFKWYIDICEPDTQYEELLTLLKSNDFKVVVKVVEKNSAFATISNGLTKLGVDVHALQMLLGSLFGWFSDV